MNRLHHLKQTLPLNLMDSFGYPDTEFVLLDYNSSDGLEQYVLSELSVYINNNKLIYFRTESPHYFNRSHSRNLAFRLASGDIICNIDADNFTGKGLANYINQVFNKEKNIFLTNIKSGALIDSQKDILGKVCLRKEDFIKVCGYDESMVNYGFEDFDLVNRLELSGLLSQSFGFNSIGQSAIAHQVEESLKNEEISCRLESILLNYITPSSTELIFLLKDGFFLKGVLTDNFAYNLELDTFQYKQSLSKYQFSLKNDELIRGKWKSVSDRILITNDSDLHVIQLKHTNIPYLLLDNNNSKPYYKLADAEMVQTAIMIFSQIPNRVIMENNIRKKKIVVNEGGYGRGRVFKNFDYHSFIDL
ncbi:Glycosyltransferase like family 2 [Mucilaginibacter gossypiicola]|uniref:Glycosyltransferase like family 2 n=2 Tax=Mucilaginibacter gossypiicola TaxID=551995 RepID=A0A1H8B933_9SPHI|nr:Glycosyltransferase like family 2 [Mucilaginibacter gossypiicola]